MPLSRIPAIATLAVALSTTILAGPERATPAQDIRRIDDRSVTRDRHERAVIANIEIEGQKVEMVFQRETVPGARFLRVAASTRPGTTTGNSETSYRYLGYDREVLRFGYSRGDGEAVLTYPPNAAGRFVVIPEELQHTRLQFELTPIPERGVVQAVLLDNGLAR